jgi:hypothetical protein
VYSSSSRLIRQPLDERGALVLRRRDQRTDREELQPPIAEIVDHFERVYKDHPILYVTQVHQHLEPASLADLRAKFDWSGLQIYDINVEGMKHAVPLGTKRWPTGPGTRRSDS